MIEYAAKGAGSRIIGALPLSSSTKGQAVVIQEKKQQQ